MIIHGCLKIFTLFHFFLYRIRFLNVKIKIPKIIEYFPNRLPLGTYIIEPMLINKAPNWIEKNNSKQ
jgi:hypothetical protein